jgi:TonB family protein
MSAILFSMLLFQAAAAAPPASPAPPRPSGITQPDWLSKPTGEDFAELYPKDAARNMVEGSATISCRIDAAGALIDCAATSEAPPGAGFGAAALAMSGKFKMRPMTKDGVPVAGGVVRIPIRFVLPKSPFPPIDVAMRCYGYAAASAERDPSSEPAQMGVVAWRLMIEFMSIPEKWRPTEFEGLMTSLRKTGAERLDSDQSKGERDDCVKRVGEAAGVFARLDQLAREAAAPASAPPR